MPAGANRSSACEYTGCETWLYEGTAAWALAGSTSGTFLRWVTGMGMAEGAAAAETSGAGATGMGVEAPAAATGSGAS